MKLRASNNSGKYKECQNVLKMQKLLETNLIAVHIHFGVGHAPAEAHMYGLGEAERHNFRHAQRAAAIEGDAEVDVHHTAAPPRQQDIVQVAVPQPQEVPHLGSNSPVGTWLTKKT